MSLKRIVPSAVLAIGVTVGLTLGMADMIAAEFEPQDKAEDMAFEINPQVEEPPIVSRSERKIVVKRVETPPPPPIIERERSAKPTERIADVKGAIPEFVPPKINPIATIIAIDDREVQPLVRIAPIMPPRAEKSGHCRVRFNVSAEGAPYDVQTTYCTQSLFERATIKSVQRWKFNPKMVGGHAVAMQGVENKVSYRLSDERGNIIPE